MDTIRPSIFDWAPPDPAGGAYTALPDLLAVFMGASNGSKRRKGKGKKRAQPSKYFGLDRPCVRVR